MRTKAIAMTAGLLFFLLPSALSAQGGPGQDEIFRARVIEVIAQNDMVRDDGSVSIRQKIMAVGIEGAWEGREIIFDGTGFDVLSASEYSAGDKVLVSYSPGPEGEDNFYVIGFSRTKPVYWLAFLFALSVIAVGRLKGLRALAVLALTFLVILKFIIPRILSGGDPILAAIAGSFFILVASVFVTEGLKRTSVISVAAILLSLAATGIASAWFSALAKLTGFASEESVYLAGLAGGSINVRGLLLAGMIIGALGVLDDVVISQVALVEELKRSDPGLTDAQVYFRAMRVGISHLSSMVNTLFLAYAGASLPLLILFSVKQPPFLTFGQVIDNEIMATEIVRTLAGSIGLVLAVPIATILAAKLIDRARLRPRPDRGL